MFLVSQCCKLLVGWWHLHICNSNNWSGSHKILHSVFHNSVILLIVNKTVPSLDAILFFFYKEKKVLVILAPTQLWNIQIIKKKKIIFIFFILGFCFYLVFKLGPRLESENFTALYNILMGVQGSEMDRWVGGSHSKILHCVQIQNI